MDIYIQGQNHEVSALSIIERQYWQPVSVSTVLLSHEQINRDRYTQKSKGLTSSKLGLWTEQRLCSDQSYKKLSCHREAARCFVFVRSQLQHTYSAVFLLPITAASDILVHKILLWLGYPMVKNFRRYLYSFWHNSQTWQTHRQTPHGSIRHAYASMHKRGVCCHAVSVKTDDRFPSQ